MTVPETRVALFQRDGLRYPTAAPFHPPVQYAELERGPIDPSNRVYEAVREVFVLLGLDREHIGTPRWNPLGDIVQPGDRVVIKPNLVRESHLSRPGEWEYVISHAAVVRAVVDYVLRALAGTGEIVIADGPQTDASFDRIAAAAGYRALIEHYRRTTPVTVNLLDLREEEWTSEDGVVVARRKLAGDPRGYTRVSLGRESEFVGYAGEGRYYGASFDTAETNRVHRGDRHEYLISRTVQDCDVLINLPKLKTHKKAGITCCLKNLVGINGQKNYLPHYTQGTPEQGGDQFAISAAKQSTEQLLLRAFRGVLRRSPESFVRVLRHVKKLGRLTFGDTSTVVRSGNWHGNDTLWRMILDLNKAMLFFDGNGIRRARPRRYFAIVDGVMAGEGDGPLSPDPVPAGVLLAGTHPVAIDCAACALIGFDWHRVPAIDHAFAMTRLPLAAFQESEIEIVSNLAALRGTISSLEAASPFAFRPHFGWVGHVEARRQSVPA